MAIVYKQFRVQTTTYNCLLLDRKSLVWNNYVTNSWNKQCLVKILLRYSDLCHYPKTLINLGDPSFAKISLQYYNLKLGSSSQQGWSSSVHRATSGALTKEIHITYTATLRPTISHSDKTFIMGYNLKR